MHKFILKAGLLVLASTGLLSASQLFTLTGDPAGTALFTFSSGGFTVLVNNNTTTTDAADLLTDLMFKLSNPTGAAPSNVQLSGINGSLVNVTSTGALTTGTGSGTWGFGTYTGSYLLCTICGSSGVSDTADQASQGILGPGGGTGSTPYSTANGSIKDNSGHNPFYNIGGTTFSFTGTNITAATLANSVFLSFGTTFPDEHGTTGGGGGGGGEVPEPGSMFLLGGGLLALGFAARKRLATK